MLATRASGTCSADIRRRRDHRRRLLLDELELVFELVFELLFELLFELDSLRRLLLLEFDTFELDHL